MQVENTSLRLWTVRDQKILPGQTVELPDAYAADIVGHPDLIEVKPKEEKAKPGRPAKNKEAEE